MNVGAEAHPNDHQLDRDSQQFFGLMATDEKVRANRAPGVRTVLVVLSTVGLVFDVESLRQKIHLAYPDAAVFFQTTSGKPIGSVAPRAVDLLIDFTGPGQWGWGPEYILRSRRLRRIARVAVGRRAGIFRARIYDRIFDERTAAGLHPDRMQRERQIQREVLKLAGVAFVQQGDALPDRGYEIALELPAMRET